MSDSVSALVRGQNLNLPDERATIVVRGAAGNACCCCALAGDRKAVQGVDPAFPAMAPRVDDRFRVFHDGEGVGFDIDLAAQPTGVAKLVFLAIRGKEASPGPVLDLLSAGRVVATFDAGEGTPSSVAYLGEAYRRAGAWKFRAQGQEFRDRSDAASFLGLPESAIDAALSAAPPRPAPIPQLPAPSRVSLERPTAAPTSPRAAVGVSETRGRAIGGSAMASGSAFEARGWELTPEGIAEGTGAGVVSILDRELLDVRSGEDGRVWPAFFRFDPSTGRPLSPVTTAPSDGSGLTNGVGLPEVDVDGGVDPSRRRDVDDIPQGARLFANGGDPPRLVAIDPWEGRCWWRAPLARTWSPLDRLASAGSAPLWSLGALGTNRGVFHAAAGTLAHVLPGQSASIAHHDLEGGRAGAPFGLRGEVVVPVHADGRLRVAILGVDGSLRFLDVVGAPERMDPLGRPFGDPLSGRAIWAGARGYLSLELDAGGATGRWDDWPDEVEGLPFLGPYRARNGRFWSFGVRTSGGGRTREGAVACSVSSQGVRETRDLPGPFVSVGSAVFRGRERHRDPWSRAEEEIGLGFDYSDRWLLPLVRFGSARTLVGLVGNAGGTSTVRDFIFREGKSARTRELALAVHADNGSLTLLRQTFEISSMDDLAVFRDGDRICVHSAETDACASWPLA